ncbi:MFS transporter [Streptomyces canus]|uniref:MFS transporter n=1 Tax=Streptomyces canus TaxID=58343 RepID=UPI0003AAC209|nr:MFS transporter [Streptomyces canus]
MLTIALVDRVGSGLWASVSVLYFTYVSALSLAQVGTLAAAAGAIGIAGAPIGGKLADRFPVTRVLLIVQLVRAVASCALLTTNNYALLIAFSAVGGLGDRAASVLTKLYAARVAGPDRVRYQAFHRTVANAGWALGGLTAAAALALGTTTAYQWLLAGDALSFIASALLTLRWANPRPLPAPSSPRSTRPRRPDRRTRGATAPISPTSPPRPSSSSTTPCSRSVCPCGSRTRATPRTDSHHS